MNLLNDFKNGYRFFGYWMKQGERDYAFQFKVTSKQEIINLVNRYNGVFNCGVSMSTYIHGMPYLLFLPFDFDSKNIDNAWTDAREMYNYACKLGYECALHYSSGKGFHVFIKTVPDVYTKEQIRYIQMYFKDYLHLETSDEAVMGQWRRLMRLPGTWHMGSGGMCVCIAENSGRLLDLHKFISYDVPVKDMIIKNRGEILRHKYPCVHQLVRDRDFWIKHNVKERFEPSQIIRLSYVIEGLARNKTVEEINNKIADLGWDDYKSNKTKYQIKHIRDGRYVHPSCKTLQELGYCIIKNCKYKNRKND